MSGDSINLRGLTFLIADPNAHFCTICTHILRGFGATKVIEARDAHDAAKTFADRKVDLLLCDVHLPPKGGLAFVRSIRRDKTADHRTMPILVLTSDTRSSTVAMARDSGANMVVAKPLSATALYDRLQWVALTSRRFVQAPNYFGPDRRFKIEGFPDGVGRRKGDQAVALGEASGPALSQNEIDALIKATRDA